MADLTKLSDKELDAMIAEQQSQPDLARVSDDDLDRMISEAGGPSLPEPKRHSKADAAIMAGLQGASGNFLDELSGVGEAAGRVVGVKGIGGKFSDVELAEDGPSLDWETLRDAYRQARDKKRSLLADQAKEYPGTTAAASVAGAVVSPINKLGKGVSLAKGGAVIGGVNALGASESEDVKGMLIDTAKGTATGLVLGKGAEKVAKGADKAIEKGGEKLRSWSERFASRALGAERGTIKKIGQERVQAAGRQALDEGVLTAFGNTDDAIARNEAVKTAAMNARAAAYDKIDDAGKSAFNPLEVAAKVEQKIIGGANRAHHDTQEAVQLLEPHLQNILSRGGDNIPMKEAQKLVESLAQKAKFDSSRSTQANKIAKQVYHTVRDSINEAAETGAKAVGTKGLRETIEAANATYAKGMTSSTLLGNKLAREQGNKFGFGLTDTIWGGAAVGYGGATGDYQNAVALMAGKKYLEKYGAQQAALAINKISKGLLKAPGMAEAAQKSPPLFISIAQKLEGKAPRAAAGNEDIQPELKGKDKWAADGFAKLLDHSKDAPRSPEAVAKLIGTTRGKDLLIRASDLKPGSKAMDKVLADIKKLEKGG